MRHGKATRALLREIGRALGATDAVPMSPGGSAADVVRFVCADGTSVVAKFQATGAVLVDGHEVEALRRKALQLRSVREHLPDLAPYSALVLAEFSRNGAYGFVMPYYAGDTVTERMLLGHEGTVELRCLLEVLIKHGYAQCVIPVGRGHFLDTHVRRVRRRLDVIGEHLPTVMRSADVLRINGRSTTHARELLDQIEADSGLMARLEPTALSLPIHGDAVLSNFIWHPARRPGAEFTAIDPRGTLEPWDPVYDFAKMLFSLCIYDLGMAAGFAIEVGEASNGELGVSLGLRRRSRNYYDRAAEYLQLLESAPSFGRLPLAREARWRERVLYANAMHCLAFAACRVAGARARRGAEDPGLIFAARESVAGFYLAGVAFLGLLLDAARANVEVTMPEYLNVLWGQAPPADHTTSSPAAFATGCVTDAF